MVRPERFELPTPWFVAKYSIQLSYGRVRQNYTLKQIARVTKLRVTGGEGGIRTLDTGLSPYTPLAGERLRPLGHLSAKGRKIRDYPAKIKRRLRSSLLFQPQFKGEMKLRRASDSDHAISTARSEQASQQSVADAAGISLVPDQRLYAARAPPVPCIFHR